MAICMKTTAAHLHDEVCAAKAANGRTSTIVSIRIDDDKLLKLRDDVIPASEIGHESVGDYVKWLIDTQGLRER